MVPGTVPVGEAKGHAKDRCSFGAVRVPVLLAGSNSTSMRGTMRGMYIQGRSVILGPPLGCTIARPKFRAHFGFKCKKTVFKSIF